MDNDMISQFKDIRNKTISFVEGLNPDIALIVPDGFNNNILWNVGHIIVACDHWIFPKLKQNHRAPRHYHLIFRKGTSPKTWEVDPPTIHELIDIFKKQLVEITDACLGNLDRKLPRKKILSDYLVKCIKEETHHFQRMIQIYDSIER